MSKYPGIELDLRHRQDKDGRHYAVGMSPELSGADSPILQIREVGVMMFMEKITDKDGWHEKVFDDAIVSKWRQEALAQSEQPLWEFIYTGDPYADEYAEPSRLREKMRPPREARILSEKTFDYAIAELRNKAQYYRQTKLIPTLDAQHLSVVKSDALVSSELHEDLLRAFETLKADSVGKEDWHPGSNDMQLNLVHPSLHPLVWGRSKFLKDENVGVMDAPSFMGQGETTPTQGEDYAENRKLGKFGLTVGSGNIAPELWSSKYQWLPSAVSLKDGTPKIASYINNLHPDKYPKIYGTVERLIDTVIPAWDQVLREMDRWDTLGGTERRTTRLEPITRASDSDLSLWEPFDVAKWRDVQHTPDNDTLEDINRTIELGIEDVPQQPYGGTQRGRARKEPPPPPENPPMPDYPYLREDDVHKAKWRELRDPIYPEPQGFRTIDYTPEESIRQKFAEKGLQIIVKMASAELTPAKPEYAGGNWHIEGQMNERIVATALYYVDSANVEPGSLAFRMSTSTYISDDIHAGQDEYNWLELVHGASLGPSGGVAGACLQMYGQVETRAGRVLAFPNVFHHKLSPFKLKDMTKPGHRRFIALWLCDPHQRILSTANVPPQQAAWAQPKRAADADGEIKVPEGCMTLGEAEEHRRELMKERSVQDGAVEGNWMSHEYSFCEH